MIIKSASDRTTDISALQNLSTHRDATADIKQRINNEIRNIRAGLKGEGESAYEIDFHFGSSKNWMIIHDLRIECENRVAQIDHLVINRFFDIWVCESKNFSEGIAINDHGEYSAFYGNKPYGVASPIEQNRKHIAVLESVFKSKLVNLPTRLGFSISPSINSLILVSKGARISRPKTKIDGLDSIIKNDQFKSRIDKVIDGDNNPLTLAKLISSDTLEDFARKLAALHRPIDVNWHAKFGLSKASLKPVVKANSESNPKTRKPSIAKVGAPCPTCGEQKLIRKSVARSDGTETDFLACQGYPSSCKGLFPLVAMVRQESAAYEKVDAPTTTTGEGLPCPRCGTGKQVRRKGISGKPDFLACSNYRKTKCGFTESII